MGNTCALCPLPGRLCSGCHDIRYCSHQHQKNDWQIHRHVCQKFAERGDTPDDDQVWVLHFPVDREQPEFRLLHVDEHEIPIRYDNYILSASTLRLNGCSPHCRCGFDTYDDQFMDELYHTNSCMHIYVSVLEGELDDHSVNRCIEKMTGVSSWKGTVVAFTKSARAIHMLHDQSRVRISLHMSTIFFDRILAGFHPIDAVSINCDGLVNERIMNRFTRMKINSSEVWLMSQDSEHASNLTQHTGTTLLACRRRYTPREYAAILGRRHRLAPPLDNRNGTSKLLGTPCSITDSNFGYWARNRSTENVVVMRKDRKPLTVFYLRQLCNWIEEDVRPATKESRKQVTESRRRNLNRLQRGGKPRDIEPELQAIRRRAFRRITRRRFLTHGGQRLRNEVAEETVLPEIVNNEDKTDDEMPDDHNCSDEAANDAEEEWMALEYVRLDQL